MEFQINTHRVPYERCIIYHDVIPNCNCKFRPHQSYVITFHAALSCGEAVFFILESTKSHVITISVCLPSSTKVRSRVQTYKQLFSYHGRQFHMRDLIEPKFRHLRFTCSMLLFCHVIFTVYCMMRLYTRLIQY